MLRYYKIIVEIFHFENKIKQHSVNVCWLMRELQGSKIQAPEMRFLRSVKECSRVDRFRNDEIKQGLGTFRINHMIQKTVWN